MSFDHKDFVDSLATRVPLERKREHFAVARQALSLAVECEALTGIESWDRYRTVLQGHQAKFDELAANWRDKLSDPRLVNHEEMVKCKIHYAMAKSSADVFRYCLELPLTLIGEKEEIAATAKEIEDSIQKLLDSLENREVA